MGQVQPTSVSLNVALWRMALCRQHGVRELWSADRDFSRFAGRRLPAWAGGVVLILLGLWSI